MKRLLALLLSCAVLATGCGKSRPIDAAGGDLSGEAAADATGQDPAATGDADEPATGAEGDGATPTTEPPAPTTTAPAGDVAATITFDDGETVELLHGDTNDIAVPTRENEEFVGLVYQGQVPVGFDGVVLSQRVVQAVMDHELTAAGAEVSPENEAEARELLLTDLQNLLSMSATGDPVADSERLLDEVPYLPFIVGLQARQLSLADKLAESTEAGTGDPCARHILVETEEEAQEVRQELEGGADFAELAAERSIDPSAATNGGDLGCLPATTYVPPFAEAVTDAPTGELLGPVETDFGFHVIIVDGYEVNGDSLAEEAITTGLQAIEVDVDERVGEWDPQLLTIRPPEG